MAARRSSKPSAVVRRRPSEFAFNRRRPRTLRMTANDSQSGRTGSANGYGSGLAAGSCRRRFSESFVVATSPGRQGPSGSPWDARPIGTVSESSSTMLSALGPGLHRRTPLARRSEVVRDGDDGDDVVSQGYSASKLITAGRTVA